MNADKTLICVYLRSSAAYCLDLVTRDPDSLSTLYRTHRCDSTFFISCNRGDVFLFHFRQCDVGEVRVSLVPVEARKVFLQPRLFEHFAVARIDLLSHLAGVFEE